MIIPHFMLSNLIFSYHFSFTALHCTALSCIIVFCHNKFLFLFNFHLKFLSLLLLSNDLFHFFHNCSYHSNYFFNFLDHRSQYCHYCYYSFSSYYHFLIFSVLSNNMIIITVITISINYKKIRLVFSMILNSMACISI